MPNLTETRVHRRLLRVAGPALAVAVMAACAADSDAVPAAENEAAMGDSPAVSVAANTLTDEERAAGWRLLFDGESLTGWRGIGIDSVPSAHWVIEDGAIKKIPSGDVPVQADGQPTAGGDLMTTETFGDFELAFDWRVSEGGNSGIKYNVSEELSIANPPRSAALGFEYQILDDDRHPDANAGVDGNRKAAGLYDLIPAGDAKPINPPGEWNHGRIVFQGNHGEHW